MTPEQVRLILGRDEQPASFDAEHFYGTRVLVTGANGSIGEALVPLLRDLGAEVAATDIDTLDVRHESAVSKTLEQVGPDLVFHLAAQKHAPEGEGFPMSTWRTNILGTQNILVHGVHGTHTVLASTCKAIEPETVYGATKLVAERLVLNEGGTVVRLYNVIPASGNVFEIWEGMKDPVPVTDCFRYFISQQEAVCALLAAASREPGRYSPCAGMARFMPAVANDLERDTYRIPPRRGDRLVEPRVGLCEYSYAEDGLYRVVSHHDAEKVRELA